MAARRTKRLVQQFNPTRCPLLKQITSGYGANERAGWGRDMVGMGDAVLTCADVAVRGMMRAIVTSNLDFALVDLTGRRMSLPPVSTALKCTPSHDRSALGSRAARESAEEKPTAMWATLLSHSSSHLDQSSIIYHIKKKKTPRLKKQNTKVWIMRV